MRKTLSRVAAAAALCCLALALGRPAEGYRFWAYPPSGNFNFWRADSPASSWNNGTSTFLWTLTTAGFPHASLPSVDAAGAAVANGLQSIEDVSNSRIRFQRLPNSNTRIAVNDDIVTVEFASTAFAPPLNSFFGPVGNINGIFALVIPEFDNVTGSIASMDIAFNVEPGEFDWSVVAPGQPAGWWDIEVTLIHEALHAIGMGHTSYFYAGLYQLGRFPELELLDRCYSPDDRNGISSAYPQGNPLATITGTVTGVGGTLTDVCIVATDANGVVQGTAYTNAGGGYTIQVPPGTYSITAHHLDNVYPFSELATVPDFINSSTVTTGAIAAGGASAGNNPALTAGTPTMGLDEIGIMPNTDFQAVYLDRGSSQTVRLLVYDADGPFTQAEIASVNLGLGITAAVVGASAAGPDTTYVDVSANVAANATPGPRSVILVRTNNERVVAPAYVQILDVGALSLSGAANPASVPLGTADHVMLEFQLTASAVEDVRVRRLQFDVANSGGAPALTSVKLWRDANANGTLETGTDARILSSAAYVNTPPSETVPHPGSGQLIFSNIGIPILAGQTETFFLTFDIPAAGSGGYTVSLAPAGFTNQTHGMFYGDVIVPTGATASGGLQTIGAVGVTGLGQFENIGGNPAIPVGGSTATASVVIRGTLAGSAGDLHLEVEVKPLGTAFNGAGTTSSTPSPTSPLLHEVVVTPLVNATSYHWRARGVSSTLGAGPWSSFGGNLETAIDFSVDSSVVTINAVDQLDRFQAPLAIGGTTDGVVYLEGQVTNAPVGPDVALQVEIVAAGAAFTGTPLRTSAFAVSGTVCRVTVNNLPTGDYRWRARGINEFGTTSAWTDFGGNGTAMDFHFNQLAVLSASGGCLGTASTAAPWGAAGLLGGLLLLACAGRRGRKPAAVLIALIAAAGAAAADDFALPTSLSAPSMQSPPKPWLSLQAYTGLELLDLEFDAVGADLRPREIEGMGLATLGLEGLFHLGEDFRLGAVVEVGWWQESMVVSAGPVLAWRFAASRSAAFKPPEMEHYLKVGALYRTLDISESDFGDFEATFGFRGGYEMRLLVGDSLQVAIGLDARFSPFEYDEPVVSGDTETGGFGLLISIGLSWLP